MAKEISENLATLKGQRVLIFGDIGIDEYLLGSVHRISPEAPVPVVDVHSKSHKLGLAANVAGNIQSLGGHPLLVSVIGADEESQKLKALMNEQGLSTADLVADPSRKTTSKTRVLCGQHHIVRFDSETKTALASATTRALEDRLEALLPSCDIVILQDYAKGVVDPKTSQMVLQKARAAGKRVLVDPHKETPLSSYAGAFLMTPNRDEAQELVRQLPSLSSQASVDEQGQGLMEAIGADHMMITLGAEGMKIFSDASQTQIPTFAKQVFDVTGAGDTVISAVALGLAAGWPLERAGFLANLAAGVVVGHVGAMACGLEELKTALAQHL